MLCYAMLCYAVLCYAVLCYAVLCCAVICCAVLCYAMLCYAMLCYAMLCCTVLCCDVLCCAVLCCAVLRSAALGTNLTLAPFFWDNHAVAAVLASASVGDFRGWVACDLGNIISTLAHDLVGAGVPRAAKKKVQKCIYLP